MKNSIFLFLIGISFISNGQLVLVDSFPDITRLIYLDDNEPAIMVYNRYENHIDLYGQDFSLISEFDIPISYESVTLTYNLFHVSRSLFDCDSTNIEYMISFGGYNEGDPIWVKVFRDSGEEIFSLDGYTFIDNTSVGINPDYGSSMIEVDDGVLFQFEEFWGVGVKIYHSCGHIPEFANSLSNNTEVSIDEENAENEELFPSILYPNPGVDFFKVEYTLPDDYEKGVLVIFDLNGHIINSFDVGNFMNHIRVNTSEWATGNYKVVLKSTGGLVLTNSFLKIE